MVSPVLTAYCEKKGALLVTLCVKGGINKEVRPEDTGERERKTINHWQGVLARPH